eukprot:TRINITY_DN3559_c0_g1_i2.p1 TRINITY_DN3559_c0_g1~~TRINITY_DN3559_c0_g1_i2.p1  ORF type:complete len:436 (+),score=76.60 TRINITY_DN3559_c0_g1_i2:24-1331(+)
MWVTALASILLLAVYIIVKVFVWPRWQYRAIERLPGPKRNFMGTLAAFEMGDRFLEKCRENMLFYKTTFRAWLGPNFPVVYCVDLEHVEKVLREPTVVKGYSYEFLYQWLGQSVLVAPGGPALARRRKIFSHGFRTEVVKYFVSTFRPHVNKLIRSLETAADRAEPVDVLKETAKLSLDVIAECGMGAQVNAQDEADSPYLKALDSIVRGLFERILNPLLHFNVTWYLSSLGRRLRRNISTFNATSYRVLDERQRLRAQGVADVRQDFLTILLDARLEDGTALSREFIINEVNTFMFAGHDTTATATLFTLACLAKNRQYAELVREEADRLLKDDITVEMLDSLSMSTLQRMSLHKHASTKRCDCTHQSPPSPAHFRNQWKSAVSLYRPVSNATSVCTRIIAIRTSGHSRLFTIRTDSLGMQCCSGIQLHSFRLQ